MQDGHYILEYNDREGQFHFNSRPMASTLGWEVLCKSLSYEQCHEFANLMLKKYQSLRYPSKAEVYPSFETIKQEFIKFLLT